MKVKRRYFFLLCGFIILLKGTFAQGEGPLFSLLPPSKTHIQFNNVLKDTREHNIMIYSNYYGGAGVGILDVNNDGLLDLFFAGNLVADKLYLNTGNWEFEDITEKAGIEDNGGWSSGVVIGDVNNDGFQDIYVTRELYDDKPELRRNKLYINQKNGTFREEAEAYGLADEQRTRHAAFLDYDKDGDLDVYVCNQPPNPGDYSPYYNTELLLEKYHAKLMENQGGTFVDVSEKAGLKRTGFPNSVMVSDLNGDGWQDLYVANDFWVGDWLYYNNGDGTFTDKVLENVRHTSFSSMGVDAGDINNDGHLDVMVVDMVAEDNFRLKANMSGMNPKAFWKVVNEGGHHQYMFNTLQLNNGNGHFSDVAQIGNVASTDWSWSVLFADFDNDGWKDIFVGNGLMRDIRNKDSEKKFKDHIESAVFAYLQNNPNPEGVSVWDIVDINESLAIVPSEKLSNYMFKNNGDLTFSKKMADWGFEEKTFSNGAAYADLDNDGDLDLVVNNINDVASVYQNHSVERGKSNYIRVLPIVKDHSQSTLGVKVWVETGAGEQFHEITSVRGMYSTSENTAHFGIGESETVQAVRVLWPDGKEQSWENVKANQTLLASYKKAKHKSSPGQPENPPLLTALDQDIGLNYFHKENPFDDYRSQVLLPHKMSGFGPILGTGDVNGDDREDLFIGGPATEPAQIYTQKENGTFSLIENPVFISEKLYEDIGSVFVDVDNDGDQDLYVVSGGNEFLKGSYNYYDRLYLNDGAGHFTKAQDLIPTDAEISGSKVISEDFDKDGDMDLVVGGRHVPQAYPEPTSTYILRNVGGKFENATSSLAPELLNIGMVNDLKWADLDADGWMDLVVLGEWMPVRIFMNMQGNSFRSIEIPQSEGWWFSVEIADMDKDGDLDIVAGNLGLNYKYKASDTEPFEVYHYDFDDNGKKDIVLTYYNFGIQYPLRGKQCSAEQIPMLNNKFKEYNAFAASDVFDIYGDEKLNNSLHLEAHTFAHTYFENLGQGRFKGHRLPQMAQLSSINAMVIQDVNQDAHLDILMAGNLYDAEVETARNDAGYGLLLLGNGKGDFEALSPNESGFFVPYDVKSMATLQASGKQFVVVGVNHGEMKVFQLPAPLKK